MREEQIDISEAIVVDWSFDEDEKNNYKLLIDRSTHDFNTGDRVKLRMHGLSKYRLGTILHIDNAFIIVHTDEWLDLCEDYILEKV